MLSRFLKKTFVFKLFTVAVIGFLSFLLISCKKDEINNGTVASPAKAVLTITQSTAIKSAAFFDANLTKLGSLSAYAKISGDPLSPMVIDPSRISVVSDPVYGAQRKVMLMNVRIQDNGGLTENPRAQVQTPMNYTSGQQVYIGFSVRFTKTFWTYFLTFSELYGAPYAGTSPFRMAIQGNEIVASSTDNGKQTNLWQQPMQANEWYDFVYREVLSTDASKGQVEIWLRKQGETTFTEILHTAKLATITAANLTGPNYHKLACYYDKSNTFTDATKKTKVSAIEMYLGNHKVGSTFDMVAPALIR